MDKRLAVGCVMALAAIPSGGIYGPDKFPAKGASGWMEELNPSRIPKVAVCPFKGELGSSLWRGLE